MTQREMHELPGLPAFDLVDHLYRQRRFSVRTFGPGTREKGVIDHIRKETGEIERKPDDLTEWVDLILLALDGAWRQGFTPEQIAAAIEAKQTRNEGRTWPDWRTMSADQAIEHVRAPGEAAPAQDVPEDATDLPAARPCGASAGERAEIAVAAALLDDVGGGP